MAITPAGTGTIFKRTKPDNTVVWCAEVVVGYQLGGKPRKTRRTFKTQSEAKRGLNALVAQRERGHLYVLQNETLEQFALRWVREVKATQVRPSTLSDYEYRLRQYVFPYLGHIQLRELKARDIESWMSMLLREGKSTSTVSGARRILFGLCKHAYRQEILNRNPVEQTDPPKRQASEVTQVQEPWTEKEVVHALECAQAESSFEQKDISLFLTLALFLGLRRGEILGLQWQDIDFEGNTLKIRRTLKELKTLTKSGKMVVTLTTDDPKTRSSARTLPIAPQVRQALEQQQMRQDVAKINAAGDWDQTGWVLTTQTGSAVHPSNLSHRYRKFIKQHGLRQIRIHDMRHTTAVLALSSGIPLETLSQGLGHSRIDITKDVYARHVPKLNQDFGFGISAYIASKTEFFELDKACQSVPAYFMESVEEHNSKNPSPLDVFNFDQEAS